MNDGAGIKADKRGQIAPGVQLDDFLPYLLNRIANRLNMALAEDLKALGMSVPDYRILAVLTAGNPRTVKELAVYTVTGQSTLSKSLDRMEAADLIERRADPGDGRIVNVHITVKGEQSFKRIMPVALSHYRRALRGFDAGQRRQLTAMLHDILDNIRKSDFP